MENLLFTVEVLYKYISRFIKRIINTQTEYSMKIECAGSSQQTNVNRPPSMQRVAVYNVILFKMKFI
ncbi:hypothetical protein CA598_15015 [Paenibacillus sp. VTT E-133291]|nr:hypothetical protein CA598_15015 [Paenibacillus sp. VTT E-133291]